jgi:hypothetical protein
VPSQLGLPHLTDALRADPSRRQTGGRACSQSPSHQGWELKDGIRPTIGEEVAAEDGAVNRERRTVAVQKDNVEREPHPKGVHAGTARDQQPRPGFSQIEIRQAQQASREPRCDRHLPAKERGGWKATEPRRDGFACHSELSGPTGKLTP